MKATYRILWILAIFFLPPAAMAQFQERQIGDTAKYNTLIPEEKQGLLKNMSMIANMRFAERNEFYADDDTSVFMGSRFTIEQFRLEIRGNITDKIYFRFRDRYTRAQEPQSVDGISRSTDLAFVRIAATPKLSVSIGKMCADWGAYEFDYNPIDIYEYSDIIEYADNFLTGVGVSYQATKNHQFTFQALDSRTKTFDELYGDQPDKVESKVPLALVANWRGSLFDGKFNTIWSYAIHTEAENTFMNYIALGNQLKLGKFTIEYDYKWSSEQLDRTHIISDDIPDDLYPYAVENTLYVGHWLHLYYRLNPKINLALVGMMDVAKWKGEDPLYPDKTDDIRTAYGIIPTLEFYPWEKYNFRFYINYIGRFYDYSDYATQRLEDVKDHTDSRISIGFVSPLGIF
jgi:hypothetical protein